MDTSLRNWALTIGSALVIVAIDTGHGQLVMRTAGHVMVMAWWIVWSL